ncbi:MAG TPA: tetratricopeptide repeat-containing serine protease family protein [Pyrinomonadaceae bacterium]|jgi:tetratricopeptide (TPR) repeat protein|nr:tetratricopeptide repeat-containing serine protease family protein [Pyrinomonadaceae bacterium]
MYKRIFPQLLLLAVAILVSKPVFAQETLPELVRRVKPSVVAIATYDAQGEALMTGSGFFLRAGQVVTNLHVIRGATRCEIKTLDGKGKVYPVAGLLAVDEEGDLALLKVEMPGDSSGRSRSSELAQVLPDEGEQIVVIGNPLKLEGSVTSGIVSAVREVPNVGKIVQITAPISHGNSGSPVFNMKGEVVGVVTVKVTNGQNINLAIGAARVGQMQPGQLRTLASLPARERPSDVAESSYRIGLDSLWLGNYDNAIGFFETAANRNPRRADAWVQVGYCKVKQGKSVEAIRAYQHALELRPNSEEIHNKLGDAYYYAGRMNEAIASYSRAASLRPDDAEAHYNLAVAYFETGNERLASAEAKTLHQLDAKLYEKLLSETRLER